MDDCILLFIYATEVQERFARERFRLSEKELKLPKKLILVNLDR